MTGARKSDQPGGSFLLSVNAVWNHLGLPTAAGYELINRGEIARVKIAPSVSAEIRSAHSSRPTHVG